MTRSSSEAVGDAELDRRIDELYAEAPEAFVAAREALVKALRAEKRRAEAAEVHALARPTLAAWAAGRAALARPDLLAALSAAGEALREAQRQALSGRATTLRASQDDRRAAVRALTHEALEQLRGRGRNAEAAAAGVEAVIAAASLDEA
ncbi:MAG: hypothetical protein ACKVWR_08955, partial [Acidimicrobiales bacterium]